MLLSPMWRLKRFTELLCSSIKVGTSSYHWKRHTICLNLKHENGSVGFSKFWLKATECQDIWSKLVDQIPPASNGAGTATKYQQWQTINKMAETLQINATVAVIFDMITDMTIQLNVFPHIVM